MIIIMNIIIALVGLGGIIFARNMVWQGTGMGIQPHLIILLLKLIISSIIIGFFLIFSERHLWILFILSGMINIVIFHFMEALLTQKLLVYQRESNV